MQYREIRIDLNTEFAEHLTELFWERELNYQECDQSTLDAPPPGRTRFQLYLPLEESPPAPAAPEEAEAEAVDVEELLAAVHEQVPEGAQLQIESRDRHDDEWRDAWKKYFATRRIGRIAIVPSWERQSHQAEPGEITLWLDPGRAFGTGGHATTRLCLSLIDRLHQQAAQEAPLVAELLTQETLAPQILDAGCGCGVLAIAALKLWPKARALGVLYQGLRAPDPKLRAQAAQAAHHAVAGEKHHRHEQGAEPELPVFGVDVGEHMVSRHEDDRTDQRSIKAARTAEDEDQQQFGGAVERQHIQRDELRGLRQQRPGDSGVEGADGVDGR